MQQRYEVILAGSGGQGLIVSGILLAKAAIIDGKNVVQTQTYGIAQRGGFSAAEVIIADDEILYQQVQQPDMIVALSESVLKKYQGTGVPLLYDSALLAIEPKANWRGLPFSQLAAEIGDSKTANLVAVGALLTLVPMVRVDSLLTVIQGSFSAASAERNIQAVRCGIKAAQTFGEGM